MTGELFHFAVELHTTQAHFAGKGFHPKVTVNHLILHVLA